MDKAKRRVYNVTDADMRRICEILAHRDSWQNMYALAGFLQRELGIEYDQASEAASEMVRAVLSDSDPKTLPVRLDMILDDYVFDLEDEFIATTEEWHK